MTRAVGEPIIRTRRWTRREYDRLIELGVLHEDEPIELLARGRRAAYTDVRRIPPSEAIAPLAAPAALIVVADLLP